MASAVVSSSSASNMAAGDASAYTPGEEGILGAFRLLYRCSVSGFQLTTLRNHLNFISSCSSSPFQQLPSA